MNSHTEDARALRVEIEANIAMRAEKRQAMRERSLKLREKARRGSRRMGARGLEVDEGLRLPSLAGAVESHWRPAKVLAFLSFTFVLVVLAAIAVSSHDRFTQVGAALAASVLGAGVLVYEAWSGRAADEIAMRGAELRLAAIQQQLTKTDVELREGLTGELERTGHRRDVEVTAAEVETLRRRAEADIQALQRLVDDIAQRERSTGTPGARRGHPEGS